MSLVVPKIKNEEVKDQERAYWFINKYAEVLSPDGKGKSLKCENLDSKHLVVTISEKDKTPTIVKIKEFVANQKYQYIHEICATGMPEISEHYNFKMTGIDIMDKKFQLFLYLNRTCEDGESWYENKKIQFAYV